MRKISLSVAFSSLRLCRLGVLRAPIPARREAARSGGSSGAAQRRQQCPNRGPAAARTDRRRQRRLELDAAPAALELDRRQWHVGCDRRLQRSWRGRNRSTSAGPAVARRIQPVVSMEPARGDRRTGNATAGNLAS